jgi:[ribosomal protein S5]-alanine N-acetyltransferase
MDLQLVPAVPADAEALLAFELANRAWFEHWVVPRSPSYYSLEAVCAVLALAGREREMDISHQYLLKGAGAIVGRINLTGVQRVAFNKAALGYRIGQAQAGQGVATRAVALMLEEAFGKLGFWRIEANSRPENLASMRVLERNGFRQYGRATRSMQHQGAWYDQLLFERHRDADTTT